MLTTMHSAPAMPRGGGALAEEEHRSEHGEQWSAPADERVDEGEVAAAVGALQIEGVTSLEDGADGDDTDGDAIE